MMVMVKMMSVILTTAVVRQACWDASSISAVLVRPGYFDMMFSKQVTAVLCLSLTCFMFAPSPRCSGIQALSQKKCHQVLVTLSSVRIQAHLCCIPCSFKCNIIWGQLAVPILMVACLPASSTRSIFFAVHISQIRLWVSAWLRNGAESDLISLMRSRCNVL